MLDKLTNKLIKTLIVLGAILAIFLIAVPFSMACEHSEIVGEVIVEDSCTEDGIVNVYCEECGKFITEVTHAAHGHIMSDFELTTLPSVRKNGIETRYCENCGFEETREFICPHDILINHIAKEPTCTMPGLEMEVCCSCLTPTSETPIDMIPHEYGDWEVTKAATPISVGEKKRTCGWCDSYETTTYEMHMAGANSIYIPGTGINHKVTKVLSLNGLLTRMTLFIPNLRLIADLAILLFLGTDIGSWDHYTRHKLANTYTCK